MSPNHEQASELESDNVSLAPASADKQKKKRPDGTDVERYAGREKWSYRRWAWEFLRRNEHFQAACKRANSAGSDDEKIKVAAEFGLKRYKPYTESFSKGTGKPLFAAGSISSWSQIDCEEGEDRKVRVSLDGGQVLVRFDLASSLADAQILEKQIRLAEIRLKKRLKSYESNKKKEAQVRRHKVSTFGQYIRLLDLQAANKKKNKKNKTNRKNTQIEAGLLVAPKKARRLESKLETVGKEDFAPAISKRMSRAAEYANELYRYLAVLKGRPLVKNIPLEQ